MEKFFFARIEAWVLYLLVLLGVALGAAWGYAATVGNVFPGPQVREIHSVIVGEPGDNRPLSVRLVSDDVLFRPRRLMARDPSHLDVEHPFLSIRPKDPSPRPLPRWEEMRIAAPSEGEVRYFLIYGSFVFEAEQRVIGTILVDTAGVLHRAWPMGDPGLPFSGMHIGMDLSPEGTIAVNANGRLWGYDWCGGEKWAAQWALPAGGEHIHHDSPGATDWHHDITWHDGAFHTFRGTSIVSVSDETGDILREISLIDVLQQSWVQGLSILDTRNGIFPPEDLTVETSPDLLHQDPFHPNKVDILAEAKAGDFPGLAAGDLLLSLRELNLVFVLRPEPLEILWWRNDILSRQHDATFTDGAVEIFNNAPFQPHTRPTIRRLSYEDQTFTDIFDLSDWGLDMPARGNFERSGDQLLTVDDDSGRMIAGRLSGELDVVFENGFRDVVLQLRNAKELTEAEFLDLEERCEI